MDGLKNWWIDIWCFVVSAGCWLTVEHCQMITSRLALVISVLTLFFITLPKVYIQIRRFIHMFIDDFDRWSKKGFFCKKCR